MTKGNDIQERLIDFAVSIIHLSAELPKTQAGQHLAGQLLEHGTSPAPTYAEVRIADSLDELIHQFRRTLKALNETGVWLQIIKRSDMLSAVQLDFVTKECEQLSEIVSTSLKTALAQKG